MRENVNNQTRNNEERRHSVSIMRTGINIVIVICLAVTFALVGMFVLDDIGVGIENSATYWTQKVLSGVGSLLMLFACANITEETLKRKNKYYQERLNSLDGNYTDIMTNGETAQIELYLTNKNKRNKYFAYLRRYKRLLQIAKGKKLKEYCERKLLLSPDEVWAMVLPRIRYNKLTFDKLISGASAVVPNDDTADIDIHRMKYAIQKTLWKALCIIGFGCYVPDLVYHFTEFTSEMILPMIFKIIVVLWSVYSGVCFGYAMMDRILIVLKRKLVVFSEFRTRTKNFPNAADSERYAVTIENDKAVEKLKAKYAAEIEKKEGKPSVKQFIPISPGGLVRQIAVKHILKNNQ